MRSDDISADILGEPPSGDRDIGIRKGTVLAWNDLTGENTVDIEGQLFEDLDVLISGIGVRYSVGDAVSIVRQQSRYYIQGRIGSVNGAAGSSIQEVLSNVSDTVTPTAGAWIDVPSGPVKTDVYIGSSRSALVMWRTDISVNNSTGEVGWAISGASSAAPGAAAGTSIIHSANTSGTPSTAVKATLSGFFYLSRGRVYQVNQGLHTFTMKYRVSVTGTGINATFGSPQMTVIPL